MRRWFEQRRELSTGPCRGCAQKGFRRVKEHINMPSLVAALRRLRLGKTRADGADES